MASGAAASSVLSTMAKLQESRASTGDFTITCQGTEIKAHSYVLANGLVLLNPSTPTQV